ncbi:MAG: AMP-binding protein [Anaerolineales bacterium]|nr:MAG: AMP-binding protein [Anaerolineales bacterium]
MNEQYQNLNQALLATMDTFDSRPCFQIRRGDRYQGTSYRRFKALTLRLAGFFRDSGVARGERVAIIGDNCLEWMLAYAACLLTGGVAVPLPTSLAPDMLCFILQDSGARLAVLQDERQSRILESIVRELPELDTVLAINIDEVSLQGAFPMAAVLDRPLTSQANQAIRADAQSIHPQALASIHYTAGKTDRPRGAVFDHAQRLSAMQHLAEWFTLSQDDVAFTFAPWSYLPSLDAALHTFLSGVTNVLAESRQATFDNLQQTSPTLGLTTPYTLEQVYQLIIDKISQLPESSRDAFHWALATSREYHAAGLAASQELRERYARADMTFFSQIRGWMGGRLRRLYSVGAPLPQELAEFLEAIGLLALDTYNTVEAGGFPAVNRPGSRRARSCGQVAPGFQVRIDEDGEVLVRGETVMREYWGQPQETRQAVDSDGWLHTGDLGRFDRDGYLYLTGRKQSLIVLSTGRKVVPTSIERALMASPLIDQAAVFGDGQFYISALIVPNLEGVAARLGESGHGPADLATLPTSPWVRKLLDQVVLEVNSQLARWEWIRGYSILDQPLFETVDELSPKTDIDRQAIAEQYAAQIESMYPMPVRLAEKAVTQVQVEPEHLRELLEKQDILDAWMEDAGIGFLFDLARAKGIDATSMVSICDAVVAIAQMQSEEKPLSTALIVGDLAHMARILPHSEIQLQRHDHIRRMRQVVIALAKMVDGLVLGYGVDKHGYVRGIHKLDVALDDGVDLLLGPRFRHQAAISRQCDAVVFFVPPGGRQVRVFADGRPAGRYANGRWSPESLWRVDEALTRLAKQKECDVALLRKVLRCAFRMSEQNLGAIFVLGDADAILERSDPPEISSFATIARADIERLSDQELVNFAKQDGATVIDLQGEFKGCMVLLRPAADTQAEIGLGKGARHSSAAKISAEGQCLAITVSQDGPITVYDSGQRILVL